MIGGVIRLMSCNPLSDARMSLLCFQVVRFGDNNRTSLWNFTTWCLFMLSRFPLSRFIMHSPRNRINSFGQDWRQRLLHWWASHWNTWRVKILCVYRPKFLTVSAVQECKILREWVRCLYNNVIDRLCLATNQSTNDQREQKLHLDTKEIDLNQDPTVC